jgi:hypothetical protein
MPYTLQGEITNKCSAHKNKLIYSNTATLLDVILRTQKEQGIKLSWYPCEVHGGYHLCKFENKRD